MKKHFCPYCMAPVNEGEPCAACGLTSGTYSPSPHHLPPGTILVDRYLVGRVLGEGGFGITYIGCDLRLELKVAIKEYFPTDKVTRHAKASLEVSNYTGIMAGSYEQGKEKYLQEARTMARMNKQPEIVSVRDFFETNNTAYIVMEYVEGTTFKELVAQKGGRIPAGEFLHMIEPLFSALSVMHETGLIHRDISPDNLMLENGCVRLLDFGCARESSHGTETMTIALKHGYAPIEQYQHKGQGPWTDVYGLCATMYYCLTGKVPQQSLDRLCEDELILPRKLGVDLTENQERALLFGMGIRPRRRYQGVQELYAALYTGVPAPKIEAGQSLIFTPETNPSPAAAQNGEGAAPGERQSETAGTADILKTEAVNGNPMTEDDRDTDETSEAEAVANDKDTESNPEDTTAGKKKKTIHRLKIAAAAIAVIGLAASPFLLQEKLKPTSSNDVSESIPPEEENPDIEKDPFENASIVTVASEASLRKALSGDAEAIVWQGNGGIALTGEELVLTKPLYIGETAHIQIATQVTVESGGLIKVAGELENMGFLQIKGDGKLEIEEGGRLSGCSPVVVEKDENFVVENGGITEILGEDFAVTGYDRLNYVSFSEEAFFANAIHVRTAQQLQDALGRSSPIVIDDDITLKEGIRYMDRSVMVSPGVTVTGMWDNETSLCFDGWYFVNYGTIEGCFQVGDWNGDGSVSNVFNYGQISNDMYVESLCNIFNAGRMTLGSGWSREGRFYNLGELVHDNSYEGDTSLEFLNGRVTNLGTIRVEGDESRNMQTRLKFASGTEVRNYSVIEIGPYSTLENAAIIEGYGEILVMESAADTAEVWNNGIIRLDYAPSSRKAAALEVQIGDHFGNEGLIMYSVNSSLRIPREMNEYNGAFIPFAWGDDYRMFRVATTGRELKEALADDACSMVFVGDASEITLEEELVVTKPLLLEWRSSLNFTNGGLTLTGENAYFYNDGELLLNGNGISVSDGAVVYIRNMERCGDLRAESRGYIILRADQENSFAPGYSITLENGGFLLTTAYGNRLENRTVSIGDGSVFRMINHLSDMEDTDITIQEGGELLIEIPNNRIDENSVITNDGKFCLGAYDECVLNGEITNNNSMECYVSLNMDGGKLVNNGNLRVDIGDQSFTGNGIIENNGTIFTPHEEFMREYRGDYRGNEVVLE